MTPQDNADIIEANDELTVLKARADLVGLSYHPSIKADKLREKLAAHLADPDDKGSTTQTSDSADRAAEVSEHQRLIDEASKLVRIRLTCMNPNKKDWQGEIYTVSNAVVGTYKKFVPFNADEGWHVPNIIYEHLKARECQVFVTKRDEKGNASRKGKIIKEFAIELLDPLTPEELRELATTQAAAHSID